MSINNTRREKNSTQPAYPMFVRLSTDISKKLLTISQIIDKLLGMDISETIPPLITFFTTHDHFIYPDDYSKLHKELRLVTDDMELNKLRFFYGLQEMVASALLVQHEKEPGKFIFLLKRPLVSESQELTIGPELATYIAQLLNSFAEKTKNASFVCDPQKLTERDIASVFSLASGAMGILIDKAKKDE